MRRVIETGLRKPVAPHAWAIEANDTLHSVHVPIRPDGSIETGDATRQTEVSLRDLRATLEAAGATLADVTPVQIFLTTEHDPACVGRAFQAGFGEGFRASEGLPRLVTVAAAISQLGSWFSSTQYNPTDRTASVNCWKSTGFTM